MNWINAALILTSIALLAWVVMNRMAWLPSVVVALLNWLPDFLFVETRIRMFVEKWALAEITLQWFISEPESEVNSRRSKMNADIITDIDFGYTLILGYHDTIKLSLDDDEMLKTRVVNMLASMEALEKQVKMTEFSPTKSIRKQYKKTLLTLGIR